MAWLHWCMQPIRARLTCVVCFCSMGLMSTATSMNMDILLSCLLASQVPQCVLLKFVAAIVRLSWSASQKYDPGLTKLWLTHFSLIIVGSLCAVFLIIKPLIPLPPGKTDITSMMLDAGAETDLVNSVGRTAAQMAAFVGETGKDCTASYWRLWGRLHLVCSPSRPAWLCNRNQQLLLTGEAGVLHQTTGAGEGAQASPWAGRTPAQDHHDNQPQPSQGETC